VALRAAATPRLVETGLLGLVEHPSMAPGSPYAIDRDGRPFVPAGDGGIVLGVGLGDGVFAHDADHVAPGVCLVHPDPAARLALTAQACLGNPAVVLGGAAAGAPGRVVGKRGEAGRVIVAFAPEVTARLLPGDRVRVAARGQGSRLAGMEAVRVLNLDPSLLAVLPVRVDDDQVAVRVHARLPARLCGNGVGRPAALWDVDVQIDPAGAAAHGGAGLRLGDLVALTDWDARWNHGYRRDAVTIGVVVHGASRVPGHGPGVVAILTGPGERLAADAGAGPDDNLAALLPRMAGTEANA